MTVAHKQSGFTIIELLVTLSLMMIITTAISVFVINGLRNYTVAAIKGELLAQAQTASDKISGDIMLSASADQSNRIDDPNPPVAGDPTSWDSGASVLVLASAVEDTSGKIMYADPANYVSYKNNIIYYVSNGSLYRRTLAASVSGNKARTTCPPSKATATCPADGLILTDVISVTFSYRNHLDQTVVADEARSVEVSVVTKRRNDKATEVKYISRTVFRNE